MGIVMERGGANREKVGETRWKGCDSCIAYCSTSWRRAAKLGEPQPEAGSCTRDMQDRNVKMSFVLSCSKPFLITAFINLILNHVATAAPFLSPYSLQLLANLPSLAWP